MKEQAVSDLLFFYLVSDGFDVDSNMGFVYSIHSITSSPLL
jgi:hypothetical protein